MRLFTFYRLIHDNLLVICIIFIYCTCVYVSSCLDESFCLSYLFVSTVVCGSGARVVSGRGRR